MRKLPIEATPPVDWHSVLAAPGDAPIRGRYRPKREPEELASREKRMQLPIAKDAYWAFLDRGKHLGYSRQVYSSSWFVRFMTTTGRYRKERLGNTDDKHIANGVDILSFDQAHAKAIEILRSNKDTTADMNLPHQRAVLIDNLPPAPPYLVRHAMGYYLEWYRHHFRSVRNPYYSAVSHIIPALGDIPISELSTRQIREWHIRLAETPARLRFAKGKTPQYRPLPHDSESIRRRKNSSNWVLAMLKKALTLAYQNGHVETPDAWNRVMPFRGANKGKGRILSPEECRRLVRACQPDFRRLVIGALETGCRIAELRAMKVENYIRRLRRVVVTDAKKNRQRHVTLSKEGDLFFQILTAGRDNGDVMFVRNDGRSWHPKAQARKMSDACASACIDPPITFHCFRHIYASEALMAGIPTNVVAKQLGHATTKMIDLYYGHVAQSHIDEFIHDLMPSVMTP